MLFRKLVWLSTAAQFATGVTYLLGDTKKPKRDPSFDYGGGAPTP